MSPATKRSGWERSLQPLRNSASDDVAASPRGTPASSRRSLPDRPDAFLRPLCRRVGRGASGRAGDRRASGRGVLELPRFRGHLTAWADSPGERGVHAAGRLFLNGSATWSWPMPVSSSVSTSPAPCCAMHPAASQTGNAGGSLVPSAAPPLGVANAVGRAVHDPGPPKGPKGEIPLGLPLNRKTISITQERITEEQNPSPSPSTEAG
jgi:hypothetical protein